MDEEDANTDEDVVLDEPTPIIVDSDDDEKMLKTEPEDSDLDETELSNNSFSFK